MKQTSNCSHFISQFEANYFYIICSVSKINKNNVKSQINNNLSKMLHVFCQGRSCKTNVYFYQYISINLTPSHTMFPPHSSSRQSHLSFRYNPFHIGLHSIFTQQYKPHRSLSMAVLLLCLQESYRMTLQNILCPYFLLGMNSSLWVTLKALFKKMFINRPRSTILPAWMSVIKYL